MTDQTQTTTEPVIGTNSGHGHAWARPDGVRMRCGGPRMCKQCATDAARVADRLTTPQPLAIGLDREADEDARLATLANSDDRMVVVSALAAIINAGSQIRSMKFKGQCCGRHEVAECDKRISELDRAASRLSKALALAAPAEGYVLVPVSTLATAVSQADRGGNHAGCDGWRAESMCRDVFKLLSPFLPAAPTGETGA